MSNCNGLNSNPDISGIGVRLSFYLQSFILVLLVDRRSDASAVWTFIATSFGLTVAAIVQDVHNQLSLFQALQVSNLVWLANFGSFLALASYSRGKVSRKAPAEHQSVRFASMFQTVLSVVLTFYMWITSQTFGNQPECASTIKYVVFVINLAALKSGRIVGLAFTSMLAAGYLFITTHEMRSYLIRRKNTTPGLSQNKNTNSSSTATVVTESVTIAGPATTSQSQRSSFPPSVKFPNTVQRKSSTNDTLMTQTVSPDPNISPHLSTISRRRPRRRHWFMDVDPMLLGITVFQILVFGYFIVSSELLRVRNPSANDQDEQWGFGQILALIVVAPSLVSLLRAFQEHGFKRLHRRKRNRRPRRRVTVDIV